MNILLEKQLINFSCTYWPLSFCKIGKKMLRAIPELWCVTTFIYLLAFFIVQNFKKILTANRVMTMRHFWAKNGSFAPKKSFFWKKLLISFSSTYWPLSFCKILKKFLEPIQSYEMCHFRAQNDPFLLNNFFGTNHYYYFHLPIGPFHCAKFKKILTADPELWGCTIFGPKMVHLPQTIFFGKLLISFSSTY